MLSPGRRGRRAGARDRARPGRWRTARPARHTGEVGQQAAPPFARRWTSWARSGLQRVRSRVSSRHARGARSGTSLAGTSPWQRPFGIAGWASSTVLSGGPPGHSPRGSRRSRSSPSSQPGRPPLPQRGQFGGGRCGRVGPSSRAISQTDPRVFGPRSRSGSRSPAISLVVPSFGTVRGVPASDARGHRVQRALQQGVPATGAGPRLPEAMTAARHRDKMRPPAFSFLVGAPGSWRPVPKNRGLREDL